MTKYKLNKKHKDRLFRIVFREKKDLLKLYNAINNTNYTNEDDLTITTIEDVVYMGMKNDLSCIIGDVLNLYEHQSSFSPNLPLRGLLYFADIYRAYIEPIKKRLYMTKPLLIPFPQYIVFYNGTKNEPERLELKLSDLFREKQKQCMPALDCTAVMLNINLGYNRELMEKCKMLKQYAQFVACIRECMKTEENYERAVEKAVDKCIKENILVDVLRKNKAEVVDMILTEYDEEEMREFLQEEAKKDGLEEGLEEGRKIGIEGLIKCCMDFHASREETVKRVMDTFSLAEDDAKIHVEKYWK